MLDKFVIHLKNIIFFKLVVYVLLISFLIWLVPLFRGEATNAKIKSDKAWNSFSEAAVKLYSILESEEKILETFRKYDNLLHSVTHANCERKVTLINQITELSKKYNLQSPINVKLVQSDSPKNKQKGIRINNYEVILNFATSGYSSFLQVARESLAVMPENSLIISMEAKRQEILTPEIILKLSRDRYPDLIYCSINMRIREIGIGK